MMFNRRAGMAIAISSASLLGMLSAVVVPHSSSAHMRQGVAAPNPSTASIELPSLHHSIKHSDQSQAFAVTAPMPDSLFAQHSANTGSAQEGSSLGSY